MNFLETLDAEILKTELLAYLTRREQEIPHLYRWWDELR